jgi:RNA polymerase sigma-70 factor (ECF subfamily)
VPESNIHTTPATLLTRLREARDETAWQRLVHLYTPLLFFWARRCGESEHEAADLVQEVFVALLQFLPSFQHDHTPGKFRSWLRTIMLNKLRDRKRREARADKVLAQVGVEPELPDGAEAFWETEYRQELSRRALRLIQTEFAPTTWKACWETVVHGRSTEEVAQELGITENAVYVAKCRVLRRLRHELIGLME